MSTPFSLHRTLPLSGILLVLHWWSSIYFFSTFLKTHPDYVGKVVLFLHCIPNAEVMNEQPYQLLCEEIETLVGKHFKGQHVSLCMCVSVRCVSYKTLSWHAVTFAFFSQEAQMDATVRSVTLLSSTRQRHRHGRYEGSTVTQHPKNIMIFQNNIPYWFFSRLFCRRNVHCLLSVMLV